MKGSVVESFVANIMSPKKLRASSCMRRGKFLLLMNACITVVIERMP